MKHLWQIKHRYYCNNGNYFSNDCHAEYKSWNDFINEAKDEDLDYNLIFRWDWDEEGPDGENTFNGDDYYRNGVLYLYYMGQRKGLYRYVSIDVCRADEFKIKEFLLKRWEVIKEIWEPFDDIK